jgi:hypothetical protein
MTRISQYQLTPFDTPRDKYIIPTSTPATRKLLAIIAYDDAIRT